MIAELRDIHTIESYANNPHRNDNAVAAEQSGRRAFRMAIDPLYGEIIVPRWTQFTGTKAERVAAMQNWRASQQQRRDLEG